MTTYTLNIIAQGQDRASGPLGAVQSALGGLHSTGMGMLAVFGGGLLLQGFNALTSAMGGTAAQAWEAASNYQVLQIQMQGLIAANSSAEFNRANMREESYSTISRLTDAESEKLSQLSDKYRLLEIDALEQSYAIQAATEKHGANSLAVEEATIRQRELQRKMQGVKEEMDALNSRNNTMVTLTRMVNGETRTAGEMFGEAAQEAAKLVDWIDDMAVRTPFANQQIAEMTRNFLATGKGIPEVQNLVTAVTTLGAGMGLTNAQLGRFQANLVQTSRAGKITEIDLREFGNAGVPVNMVLDEMARKLGITREEALKFAKSGPEGVQAFTDAIVSTANTQFPNALGAIGQTWAVAASNFGDVIQSIIGKEIFGPILTQSAIILSGINELFLGNREAFRAVGAALGDGLEYIGARAAPLLDAFGRLGQTILTTLGIDLTGFSLTKLIDDLSVAIGNALLWALGFTNWLTNNLPGAMAAGAALFQPVIDGALALWSAFLTTLPGIIQTVQGFMVNLQLAFGTMGEQLITNVGGTLSELAVFWEQHGESVMRIVGGVFATLAVIVGGAVTLISGLITGALQMINGNWQGAADTMRDTWTALLTGILALTGTSLQEFIATWSFILGTALALVVKFGNDIKKSITDGLAAWDTVFNKQIPLILTTAFNNIIAWANEQIAKFVDVGEQMVIGIANGIIGGAGWIAQALMDAVEAAMRAARETLGIESPSREGAYIGQNIMLGIARGIGSLADLPQSTLAGALGGINAGNLAFAGAGAGGAGGYGAFGGAPVVNHNYYLSASYAYQDERELRDDVRTLQMLTSEA